MPRPDFQADNRALSLFTFNFVGLSGTFQPKSTIVNSYICSSNPLYCWINVEGGNFKYTLKHRREPEGYVYRSSFSDQRNRQAFLFLSFLFSYYRFKNTVFSGHADYILVFNDDKSLFENERS